MPKEEWGHKRLCPHCATRLYDLKADPMTCPACGNTFTVTSLTDGRGKTLVTEKTAAANDDDELVDDEEDIADDAGEIDDDLLEEDDDDGDVSLDDIADVAGDEEE
ncbi:FYDLN acid domain-containing protein [Paracoccus marcusii]|uniref:FYDLN acid domain-containing protein n=1 Tax=Paracoccus marcusii TaxID=59779 RepID=UPI002ED10240|nr:FYDLN acid domain-containing protein [Paracoccus marcusii]